MTAAHRTYRMLVPLVVAVLASTLAMPGLAAEPSQGTVSKHSDVTWRGGPLLVSTYPVGCLAPDDPRCDRFSLTVDAKEGANVLVAVTGDLDMDIFDIRVFGPDGALLASAGGTDARPSVVFIHSLAHGDGPYQVLVEPLSVFPDGGTYEAVAALTRDRAIDGERDCFPVVPTPASVSGVTDEGQQVDLAVTVLLDGISRQRGEQVLAAAAKAYEPLNITLTPRFRPVSLVGDDAVLLLQQAKDVFGGARPRNADIVYVLTSKNITHGGSDGVIGLADCIGGIRYDERAFAVSQELGEREDTDLGPFVYRVGMTATVVAHEIGHLMGGTHDYANCVEGAEAEALVSQQLSPCTVMLMFAGLSSFTFSTANAAVVRGHAVEHASP
jgi:hypothetical protein